MKSWTLSDALRAKPDLAAAVDLLRPVLDDVIGRRFRGEVSADWDLAPDGGGVTLHLADDAWPGGVQGHFRTDQLAPNDDTRYWLRWVWLELLSAGTRVIVGRMVEAAGVE